MRADGWGAYLVRGVQVGAGMRGGSEVDGAGEFPRSSKTFEEFDGCGDR